MLLFIPAIPARAADTNVDTVVGLFELVADANPDAARKCLNTLSNKVHNRELTAKQVDALRERLNDRLRGIITSDDRDHPLAFDAAVLAATWGDQAAIAAMRDAWRSSDRPDAQRIGALEALIHARDRGVFNAVRPVLTGESPASPDVRRAAIASLGRLNADRVARELIAAFPRLPADLQPVAIDVLTQRPAWSAALLDAVDAGTISKDAVNLTQLRKMLATNDEALIARIEKVFGQVRTARNEDRAKVIDRIRKLVRSTPGDAFAGQQVFTKVCAQCHTIYGDGTALGPDLTGNGRNDFEQLLSNVLDPNLVIGEDYQARLVQTADGRSLIGLLAEQNDQRIVLRLQGGKTETIAADDVLDVAVSPLSLMPEGLEQGLTETQIADLFAFLTLDRPPNDPDARRLPGVYEQEQTQEPERAQETQ